MIWIDERDVLAIHGRLLALECGQPGVRDQKLLESVLARPRRLQVSGESPDLTKLATAYMSGIVRDRPFMDGNEGTGFVIGVLFLELNGYRFKATEESAAQMMIGVAAGLFDEPVPAARRRAKAKRRKAR
jgi:death-on-curing protein